MPWLGGINPSSVNGPDPRKLRPARDPKRDQPKVNAVTPTDPPEPVDEFEPSVEALAVREHIEQSLAQHDQREREPNPDDPQEPPKPTRPRLDLRG